MNCTYACKHFVSLVVIHNITAKHHDVLHVRHRCQHVVEHLIYLGTDFINSVVGCVKSHLPDVEDDNGIN